MNLALSLFARPRQHLWRLLGLAWLTLASLLANAANGPTVLLLDGTEQGLHLQPYLGLTHDPSASLRIEQLESATLAEENAVARRDLNFGYSQAVLWLRLAVQSTATEEQHWQIEFDYPTLDHVELFQRRAGVLLHQQGGDAIAYSARSHAHRNPLFSLRLAPGETRSLYFRAHSQGSLSLSPRIWQSAAFAPHSEAQYLGLGLYFGLLLALAGYNLLLFGALRERPYLLYVLFIGSFAASMLHFNGLAAQYLWREPLPFGQHLMALSTTLTAAFAALFARSFLDTRSSTPLWHRSLGLLGSSELLVAIALLALPAALAAQISTGVAILNAQLLLAYGLYGWRRHLPGSGLFLCAWGLLLAGALLLALRSFALLPANGFTLHALQISSSLALLLLSLALATRFNEQRRQTSARQQATMDAQQVNMDALQAQELRLEQRVKERTDELAAANERLCALALHDPLTGLANRTALKQHLEQALQRSRRQARPLALMLLDLDGFKPVNDRLGHEAGDQVLLQVAQNLLSCARETDLVARLGGDEFVLICEDVRGEEHARQLAERFLQAVGAPLQLDEEWLSIGASIGIVLTLGDALDITQLLRRADIAMYQAKAAGRNRVQLASPPDPPAN